MYMIANSKAKKELLCCPQVKIQKKLGRLVGKYIFKIIFLKSAQKYQIWVPCLHHFSQKTNKQTPDLNKNGCFPNHIFFFFFNFNFCPGWVTEGNTTLFPLA